MHKGTESRNFMDFPFLPISVLLTVKPGLHTELKVFLSCINVDTCIFHTDCFSKGHSIHWLNSEGDPLPEEQLTYTSPVLKFWEISKTILGEMIGMIPSASKKLHTPVSTQPPNSLK